MDCTLDYSYEPRGLLAGSWGKTGPRTRVTRETAESNRFDLYLARTDALRDALCYLRSLDDATLLAGVDRDSPEHAEIRRWTSPAEAVMSKLRAFLKGAASLPERHQGRPTADYEADRRPAPDPGRTGDGMNFPVTWYLTDRDPGNARVVTPEEAGIEIPTGVLKWARVNGWDRMPEERIFVGTGYPGEHGLEKRTYDSVFRYLPEDQAAAIENAVIRRS
jgi:hypothetical protein